MHAMIKVRLPPSRRLRGDGEKEFKPGMSSNHGGRVVFNDILPLADAVLQPDDGAAQLQGSFPTATRCSAGARRSHCWTT